MRHTIPLRISGLVGTYGEGWKCVTVLGVATSSTVPLGSSVSTNYQMIPLMEKEGMQSKLVNDVRGHKTAWRAQHHHHHVRWCWSDVQQRRYSQHACKAIFGEDDIDGFVERAYGDKKGLEYVKRKLRRVLEMEVEEGKSPEEMTQSERKAMIELFRLHNSSMKVARGHMIQAKVLHKDKKKLILDAGVRTTSIGLHEVGPEAILKTVDGRAPEEGGVQVGDTVQVFLEEVETPEGDMLVTGQQAAVKRRVKAVWAELLERLKDGKPVKGRLLNSLSGGYSVGVAGMVCFLPNRNAAKITAARIGELADYRVIQMNASRSNVVLEDCRLQHRRQGKSGGRRDGQRGELLRF